MNGKSFWQEHYRFYDFFQNQIDWYGETIKFHVEQTEGRDNILDIGAGSGNLTVRLAEDGKENITALDSEELALDILKSKDVSQKIEIVIGNAEVLPFEDEQFNGIVSMFLLPFVSDTEKHLSEIYRVLKPQGLISVSMWAPNQRIEDGWDLRATIEHQLTKKGILPEHQDKWDVLIETTKINAKNIDDRKLTAEEMKKLLTDAGFTNIKFHKNTPYEKWAYFITAGK